MILKASLKKHIISVLLFAVIIISLFGVLFSVSAESDIEIYRDEISAIQFGDIDEPRKFDKKGVTLLSNGSSDPLYERLVMGLGEVRKEISLEGISVTKDELNAVFTKVINTNPSFFYVAASYSYKALGENIVSVSPSYTASGDALDKMRKEYDTTVSEIVELIEPTWSELEKILFIHDYIVKNFSYDPLYPNNDKVVYDSYNFLKGRVGVCQAYTLLTIELASCVGIEATSVASNDMNHIWNAVKIDGAWYHLDVTHDDPLVSQNDRFDTVVYGNFLCSDEAIKKSGHYGWSSDLTFGSKYDNLIIKEDIASIKAGKANVDVINLGKDWYVLMKKEGDGPMGLILSRLDINKNEKTELIFIEAMWQPWDNPNSYYHEDVFAGLGSYHDSVVISTQNAIYAYNEKLSEPLKIFEHDGQNGYIYGLLTDGQNAVLRVMKDPKSASNAVLEAVDLSDIKFSLEIKYQNALGEAVSDTYTAKVGWGEKFSVTSPAVEGYIFSPEKISGIMPLGGYSTEVLYESFGKLTVNYVYENGEAAAESYVDADVSVGLKYSVASPVISGYLPDISLVEGVMTHEGVTVTVTYKKALYSVNVSFVYEDGTAAFDSVSLTDLDYLAPYSVEIPTLEGYITDVTEISGEISENLDITVTYSRKKAVISIEYKHLDGKLIDVYTETVPYGEEYKIISMSVAGHTPNVSEISGVADGEDKTFTVYYSANSYTLTVKYVYRDGSEAYGATVISDLVYMQPYKISSPVIGEYIPSLEAVEGNITENTEITVTYHKAKYKVSFVIDGNIFFEAELAYLSVIGLPEALPTKESTAQYEYTFTHWEGFKEGMTITDDITFTAVFDETVRTYTVVFKNHDGKILYVTDVNYGETARYKGTTPTHRHEEGKTCKFIGWDKSLNSIKENTEVTALFGQETSIYTVYFYDADGTLIDSQQVYHGQNATLPDAPAKEADSVYKYYFERWDGMYEKVTDDSTVTAVYRKEYIEYKIVFENYDGSVFKELTLHYGDKIALDKDPAKPDGDVTRYVFVSWGENFSEIVSGDARYSPVFREEYRFTYLPEDFVNAVERIEKATTLEERFEAIKTAYTIRADVYLGDEEMADTLEKLGRETEKYNLDVERLNVGFDNAVKNSASVSFGHGEMYFGMLALAFGSLMLTKKKSVKKADSKNSDSEKKGESEK